MFFVHKNKNEEKAKNKKPETNFIIPHLLSYIVVRRKRRRETDEGR
jgi:hypothetical protein